MVTADLVRCLCATCKRVADLKAELPGAPEWCKTHKQHYEPFLDLELLMMVWCCEGCEAESNS